MKDSKLNYSFIYFFKKKGDIHNMITLTIFNKLFILIKI